jgi:excalibur calcium-binding domain-containing protein
VSSRSRRLAASVISVLALSLPVAALSSAPADAAGSTYKNCTTLQKKYPHGVGKSGAKDKVSGSSKPVTNFKKSTKIYKAAMKKNKGLDRDKDGIACEKH